MPQKIIPTLLFSMGSTINFKPVIKYLALSLLIVYLAAASEHVMCSCGVKIHCSARSWWMYQLASCQSTDFVLLSFCKKTLFPWTRQFPKAFWELPWTQLEKGKAHVWLKDVDFRHVSSAPGLWKRWGGAEDRNGEGECRVDSQHGEEAVSPGAEGALGRY